VGDFDDELPEERPKKATRPNQGASRGGSSRPAPAPKAAEPADDAADDWDDDWDDDDDDRASGTGRRDLTLILGIVAAVAVIALVVVLTRPKDNNGSVKTGGGGGGQVAGPTTLPNKTWQGSVAEGVGEKSKDVEARVAKAPGVYIWTGFDGWHVRNTTPGTVTITVAAETVSVTDTSGKPKGDKGPSVTVDVPKGDATTGVDLDLGGSTEASFTVKSGGSDVPADSIKLGGKSGQADQNPVKFTKT
jgi:hypothetical protein